MPSLLSMSNSKLGVEARKPACASRGQSGAYECKAADGSDIEGCRHHFQAFTTVEAKTSAGAEAVEDIPPGQPVPVQINSVITEVGTLELWMKHTKSDRRWKVEFLVRTE